MKRVDLRRAKHQIARPTTIRDINRQIVLNYVRDFAPISRAEIAKETALQRSTVSSIVDDLCSSGLVEEIGTGTSTGGRKPTLLKLRTDAVAAVGVDIKPNSTTIATSDLAGRILEQDTFPASEDAAQMTEEICRRIKKIIKLHRRNELEIGVSIPGVTDSAAGRALYVPYFKWRNWDIGKAVQTETGSRVTVENDANAVALAELWFGKEKIKNSRNFLTVLVAEGVGTGIIFDGQIYRGEKGAAGEFGHMIVGGSAPVPCSCGSRECWEAHASENAVIKRYRDLLGASKNGRENADIERIVSLANEGEENALKALKETVRFLGIGISNLIVGLSPQAVIVSGKITEAWSILYPELLQIAERSVRQDIPAPHIVASTLGNNPTLLGSLSLVLVKKFAAPAR